MKLEMRTLKNIAAAAMTLAVVFGAASLKPVTANAAEASVSASIEEENSYISFQDASADTSSPHNPEATPAYPSSPELQFSFWRTV